MGWAHSDTNSAKPTLARVGITRSENTGAVENIASTRRKGHSSGDSQAMIWPSEKVTTSERVNESGMPEQAAKTRPL